MTKRTTALAALIALALTGCSAHQATEKKTTPVAATEQVSPLVQRELSEGVYETVSYTHLTLPTIYSV